MEKTRRNDDKMKYNNCNNIMQPSLETTLRNFCRNEGIINIANKLNVAVGTVRRWIDMGTVPKSYTFDLYRISSIPVDYSQFSYKEKDQYYTDEAVALYCFNKFKEVIQIYGVMEIDYTYIEPSVGKGGFYNILPEHRRIGIDIEPKCQTENMITCDYLSWKPVVETNLESKKYIVIGNPPFGLRGHLALKFLNHSSQFAEFVCFILPQLFESDGKGAPRKRVHGFNLIHSEKLFTDYKDPDGNNIRVNCVFQIWSKHYLNNEYTLKQQDKEDMKVYSLSDGGTPSSTRNKEMFDKCDAYIPSTCFGEENMRCYATFTDLPKKRGYGIKFYKNRDDYITKARNIDWSKHAFLSTNSAYNIRTSQIINALSS